MKRLIVLFAALIVLLSISACSKATPDATVQTTAPVQTDPIIKTVSIDTHEELLFCGETLLLSGQVSSSDGNTAGDVILWASSDDNVATVDAAGMVTAVAPGEVTITATLEADNSVYAETTIITATHVTQVEIASAEITLLTGSDLAYANIEYQILPAEAYYQGVLFTSSDESVVTVDESGRLTAVAPGTAQITIRSEDEAFTDAVICDVTVKQGVSSIVLDQEQVDFYFGDTLKLSAQVLPEDAEDTTGVWTSSDETIATVSENGTVTALTTGTVEISFTANDGSKVKGVCTVNVIRATKKVTLTEKNVTLLLGASEDLSKKHLELIIDPEDATYQDATWTSSDESIAVVDENGIVTAVAPGKATITATTTDPRNSSRVKDTCVVTVGNAVKSIRITGVDSRITKGSFGKLTAEFTPDKVHNAKVTWSTSNDKVLTVDAYGSIRAVGVGNATITCTATDGSGVSASTKFTVYQPVTRLTPAQYGVIVLFEGQSKYLSVDVSPSDATDKGIIWSSDNTYVATVDSSGKVTAKHQGTVVITATSKDGSNKSCKFTLCVEPAVPLTVDSLGFGVYNANLLGITVENRCSRTSFKNFDFDITLYDYTGSKLDSGSYNLGNDAFMGAGRLTQIKRTLSGVSWTRKIVITITGVELSDGTFYSIPFAERETWTFTRY